MMRVSILVAVSENGVIGRGGKLPWHLSDDLKRFKQLTKGHTIVMGRKTWESIGRALPERRNVVISRQAGYQADGADVVGSLDHAIASAELAGEGDLFVIGGAEIYRLATPRADRFCFTLVNAIVEGDTVFPDFETLFMEIAESPDWVSTQSGHDADANNDYSFTFVTFQHCEPSHRRL
jgi:dihydrofolate reductase